MANQYNASFVHPSFIQANYGTEFGSGVVFNVNQLTFNSNTYHRVRSFKHRIFNSYMKCIFTWNDVGVTVTGSSPIIVGFYNIRFSYPYRDYIRFWFYVNTNNTQRTFRIDAGADQGVYSSLTGWLPMIGSPQNIGQVTAEIWIGPDNGSGQCDITWRIRVPQYGLDLYHYAFNYAPRTVIGEWFSEFYGTDPSFGQTILTGHELVASQYFVPSAISSSEVFGSPSIIGPVAQSVNSPLGILSDESWGLPQITDAATVVYPESILTGETFGFPSIARTTTVASALPPPSPAKEGDIQIVFNTYEQFVDFVLADRDVDRDDSLETAVLITLLTDKQADDGDPLPDDSGYRGGWFGDSLPVVPDYKMGTKLWLLQRAKTTREIPAIAKEYLLDGFAWMEEDGIVDSVHVVVEWRRDLKTTLAFILSFIKPEGTTIFFRFYYNWEAQILRRQ